VAEVVFPRLSEQDPTAEGVLATWFVGDGDQVADGQLLGEVMVDKVSGEVLAPAGGKVHLLVAEEETARQGDVIARIDEEHPRQARSTLRA
jgi:pyruvate/2-oxoglutarate dehydrogenase complex dihydrolipoamide acyltransferase (E2) component